MQAVISGRAGIAVLNETGRWFAVQAQAPSDALPCHPAFRNRLLNEARDLIFLDDTILASAGQRLKEEHSVTRALDIFLFLMDADLPTPVREDAALELLPLLREVQQRLANILFVRPLPAQADVEGAFNICRQSALDQLLAFLEMVSDSQPFIHLVSDAWIKVPESVFAGDDAREQVQALFTREGLFYSLVCVARGKQQLGDFLLGALILPEVRSFQNHRLILHDWVRPFQNGRGAITTEMLVYPPHRRSEG